MSAVWLCNGCSKPLDAGRINEVQTTPANAYHDRRRYDLCLDCFTVVVEFIKEFVEIQ